MVWIEGLSRGWHIVDSVGGGRRTHWEGLLKPKPRKFKKKQSLTAFPCSCWWLRARAVRAWSKRESPHSPPGASDQLLRVSLRSWAGWSPCPDACVRWAGQGVSSAPEPSVCAQEVGLDHPLLPTHAPALWSFLKGPQAPSVAEVGISAPLRDPLPRESWSVSPLAALAVPKSLGRHNQQADSGSSPAKSAWLQWTQEPLEAPPP